MQETAPKKSNRLTLYIVLALLGGIVLGYYLNTSYVAKENAVIASSDISLIKLKSQISACTDTLGNTYKELIAQKGQILQSKNVATQARDAKLDLFALLADIFLRLIKMIIAPLVFSTLVVGVAKLGDMRSVGRIGGKTLLWFIAASFLSLFLGMVLVNYFQPGLAMHLPLPDSVAGSEINHSALTLRDFMYHVFPTSIMDAMARNEILQVVVFSLFFGVATAAIGNSGQIVIKALDALAHVILKITAYIMNFAPLAVFGAMVHVIAKQGLGILQTYSIFIAEFYFGLILLLLILLTACYVVVRKKVFTMLRHIKEPTLLAFSTNSSEAAFPKLLLELERLGCENRIVSFVLPLGYSFNLAGTMMYITFATLFIAQCYGIHLDTGTQLSMLMVLMLTSKGVAGVPRAALVVIAGTLATFKIPEAGLALLLGIDPILDMGRAAMNVIGNSIATVVVSRWEKSLKA
jgi:Na+/H+-dicarboxylate symporter